MGLVGIARTVKARYHPDRYGPPLSHFEDSMNLKSIVVSMTYLVVSLVCSPALATFNWGDACSSGEGEFQQYIGHFLDVEVGTIPAGKANVEIYLSGRNRSHFNV